MVWDFSFEIKSAHKYLYKIFELSWMIKLAFQKGLENGQKSVKSQEIIFM